MIFTMLQYNDELLDDIVKNEQAISMRNNTLASIIK